MTEIERLENNTKIYGKLRNEKKRKLKSKMFKKNTDRNNDRKIRNQMNIKE